ncbi:unnamed protein product [Vitrella brassicaformis CCMP3155]|uniref:Uncharacterized protein n=2 Tax=Vitrella brassicaformis TaxID=1169539 RepID=A0A0G4G5F6_VITBC|nr:unnamed protein product [Vitrella brassicaformis CCMP3155]|eukprot:CEM23801.1 unnamed protein product [Vitrella brassicaformis CCMP3155]
MQSFIAVSLCIALALPVLSVNATGLELLNHCNKAIANRVARHAHALAAGKAAHAIDKDASAQPSECWHVEAHATIREHVSDCPLPKVCVLRPEKRQEGAGLGKPHKMSHKGACVSVEEAVKRCGGRHKIEDEDLDSNPLNGQFCTEESTTSAKL